MGLHSSAGRALQRERRGHGYESRLVRNCLNCDSTGMSHIHFICIVSHENHDDEIIIVRNRTILVHFRGISGEFDRAMVCILARRRRIEIKCP